MMLTTNTEYMLTLTLSARESNGKLICHTTCPMFKICGEPLKTLNDCPIKQHLATQQNTVDHRIHAPARNLPVTPVGNNPWPGRIRQHLSDAEISQDELCKKIGVSQPTLSNWKSGKSYPREKWQHKMIEIFKSIRKKD